MSPEAKFVCFGPFEVDLHSGELRKHGVRLKLADQPLQLLEILVRNAGQVVKREELQKELWSAGTFVDFEHGVNTAVKRLRDVLGDSPENPRFIETLPRHGYRFVYPVRWLDANDTFERGSTNPQHLPSSRFKLFHGRTRAVTYFALCVLFFGTIYVAKKFFSWVRPASATESTSIEFDILPPDGSSFVYDPSSRPLVISPDGQRIVFRAKDAEGARLYLREMNSVKAIAIPGTRAAYNPFFSPDGRWIGFSAAGAIWKVPLSGGTPVRLCPAPGTVTATWGLDANIYFSQDDTSEANSVLRMSLADGSPQALIWAPDKKAVTAGFWPLILPDRKMLLMTAFAGSRFDAEENARIVAVRTDTGVQRTLIERARDARFVPPAHLVFARDGHLFAVSFNPDRLETYGMAIPVVANVQDMAGGLGQYDISVNGTLAYLTDGFQRIESRLVLKDATGERLPFKIESRSYTAVRFSPDGRKLAFVIRSPDPDIWMYDLDRNNLRRLSFETGEDESPVWSPGGQRIAYVSNTRRQVRSIEITGSGQEQVLTTVHGHVHLKSWSPDGKTIAFEQLTDERWEIRILQLDETPISYSYLKGPFNVRSPAFSTDGHWLAYSSDESTESQIYVQRFPGPGEKIMVSTNGGTEPVWAHHGSKLYYRNGNTVMQVSVSTSPKLMVSTPHRVFENWFPSFGEAPNYDISPNGKDFVTLESDHEPVPSRIQVVLNWTAELRKLISHHL
jgi:Tol biopolymer transport system component/DNA-binding winged helix-turn-helix (wHTH) protein